MGFDIRIPNKIGAKIFVPAGRYDLFVVYEDDPSSLLKGDTFDIEKRPQNPLMKTTSAIKIDLKPVSGGNYKLR